MLERTPQAEIRWPERLFVVGTDTGVGKTVVSACLAVGLDARYWKPVQTGSRDGTDSDFLARFIGRARVEPEAYLFEPPVSPHLAAACAGVRIEEARLSALARELRGRIVIEGAGGVLTPLSPTRLYGDALPGFEAHVVVVGRTSLGAINQMLLTLEALRARGTEPFGVVLVGDEDEPVRDAIAGHGGVEVLGRLPVCENFTDGWFRERFRSLRPPLPATILEALTHDA